MSNNTIDVTPTWSDMLPVFLAVLKNGDSNGVAKEELTRMAAIADKYVREAKERAKDHFERYCQTSDLSVSK